MYKAVIVGLSVLLSACQQTVRTPFSVTDPSIEGNTIFTSGGMLQSSQQRYWYSYKVALEAAGYKAEVKKGEKGGISIAVTGLGEAPEGTDTATATAANDHFFKEGKAYARTLCSEFFARLSRAKAHRDFGRSETNIVSGIVVGGMGLAGVASEAVGGAGLLFSGAESTFEAYDAAFLATPDLALLEQLVRTEQDLVLKEAKVDGIKRVADVISLLNDYVYPCTFTGMKALLDDSIVIKTNVVKDLIKLDDGGGPTP